MGKLLKAVAVLIVLYFAISYYIASKITEETARNIDVSADFIAPNSENVSFFTTDKLTLKGWWFEPSRKKVIVFVSGILDNRTNAGYYGVDLTRELLAKGYGVLLYDTRARGESQGTVRGKNEELDVIAVVNYLKQKGVEPKNIGIISFSSGASATLMAIDKINDIGPVVIDSSPTFFKRVTDNILIKEQHVPSFIIPGVYFMTKFAFGVDINSIKPIDHVEKVPNRVFLYLHCANDTSILPENSKELLTKSNSKSKLVLFPKGKHVETYKKNPEMYRKEVFSFLDKAMK
ncbi:MAG: hypothetical protein COX79_05255 [Candidatus Levybacteria bacterium CG_4_10_14_0_2_um_filter_36_16]|nr:MAG: hypothetical protein AUK12_03675 [Candidatus Levybacteria bacterium CG2_30_37_29]PIR79239.1 MAG: hypothetical protein COU26_02205 [Candidatus Levybacteria bacterium CG10_big_fil_rev_8_21_14_0_10_36_30]PIZ96417.1 MAG: hypothetical protein COX79_05255 [Candidatus Levybacteria bacterium CG_4_10_14_0_2_um_filter_36_16]PJA90760.1 MAG: hypothetical protein CO136_00755 [Candidatus Levybacteria bacterium CG_4_9_14_3_um_filter_36_7]